MSSLEERREARRRRRQMEEEALELEKHRSLSRDDVKRVIDDRLAARRLERKQRRTESPQVNHSNNTDEDDGDKRRRERREARLRVDQERGGGGEESSTTEDRSSRRSRRRGGDDEEPAPAPVDEVDNSAADKEAEEQRRREEEEAAAEAERQRQAEEDRRKRQEEEKRQLEEKRRQRTPRTPRYERQSRPKNRTPRGPLKTSRSARQQSHLGTPSEQTIPEEEKKNQKTSIAHVSKPKNRFSDTSSQSKDNIEKTDTPRNAPEKTSAETKSNLGKRSFSSNDSVTDLYAKIDVKAKVKLLEAERNKHLFPFTSKGLDGEYENKSYTQNKEDSTSTKRMDEDSDTRSSESRSSAKRLRSIQSSSDTDFDDRLTDIVATNREMLSHDDTIERFTDFELGSCSSYDDIFPPKDKDGESVPTIDLMSTHEFTPDFQCNEVFQSRDSLLEPPTITAKKPEASSTDSSSEPQRLKSILKVKTQEEQTLRESSINRHKTRSSAKERDLKRSSSRSRTRAPPRTPSETSSDDNEHFIPFSVDNDEVIYNPEKRRESALVGKSSKGMNHNDGKNKQCFSPKSTPGVESMSENESMFSGDDVSSARNSISIGTSVENLDSDYGELMSANTTLTANADDDYRENLVKTPTPFATHENLITVTVDDMEDSFVSTVILMSPETKHKRGVDKIKDTEQRDSDNSQDSLESSLESSGFAGVKSDIPFNAKKKKINARRSGRISQMTSMWSKMPDSKEDVHKESVKSSSVDPPRKIFVIKSDRDDQEPEEASQDKSVTRHKTIESRMTELQQQLHKEETKKLEATSNVPIIKTDKTEVKKLKNSKGVQEDPHRYSEAKKKQLDELFGKLNSKLKSKDHEYQKKQYSDRQTPIFLAPFDSSVDAMQRSQSQPILNTNEEMEYYDPSQSVREYILDDESPNKTPEPQSLEYQMEEGDEVGSNKAQCSSGNTSSRLGSSSVSNWSARSNVGSGSTQDDYSESESEQEDYTVGTQEEHNEKQPQKRILKKGGKVFTRKESAFSLKSNVSDGSFQNSIAGNDFGHNPEDDEIFERQAHTQEWLQEDVGYRQSPYYRSSNISTLSNVDSTSAASIGSFDGASGVDEDFYYPEDQEYGMIIEEDGMSPGEINEVPSIGLGLQLGPECQENDDNLDLKLPLHFLNESSPDDEDGYGHHSDFAPVEDGDFDSDRCIDGSASDQDHYSSDNFEEGGLDSSRIVEYGDEYFQGSEEDGSVSEDVGFGDVEHEYYREDQREADVIDSMDAMGEDILQYLSDEMEEEGEVEEWGEEELEEEGTASVPDINQRNYNESEIPEEANNQFYQDGIVSSKDDMEEGIVYYTPNSGGGVMNEPQLALAASKTQLDLRQIVAEGNDMIRQDSYGDDGGDDYHDDGIYEIRERFDYSFERQISSSSITESARRREMFKEHHGHIDDKDIVHCDNLPHGQELPDNDEFFISFEYDEDHGQAINDDEYSEECETVHDIELPALDSQHLHPEHIEEIATIDVQDSRSNRFDECELHMKRIVAISSNDLQAAQHIEPENITVPSLSDKDLHAEQLVKSTDIKLSSENSIKVLQAHQLGEYEIFHEKESVNETVNQGGQSLHEVTDFQYTQSQATVEDSNVNYVANEAELIISPKSNRSDYEDNEIPPELKEIRKKLLSELKHFNPESLRRTSVDDDEYKMITISPPDSQPVLNNISLEEDTLRKDSLGTEQNTSLSPIELYIKTKQELSSESSVENPTMITQIHTNLLVPNSIEMSQLSVTGVRPKSNSLQPDSTTDFVKMRRNSAGGGQDGGVISKERRKSIRSFWFQLNEDEKKQKESEENWRRKRDENQNRSKERHRGKSSDGRNGQNVENNCGNSQPAGKLLDVHNQFNAAFNTNTDSSFQPLSGSMKHLDLASNSCETTTRTNGFHPQEKPHKKPPPAVAPKPRRKTTIGIMFNANSETEILKTTAPASSSKPPKPVHNRTTSVKEIASFHEKQSEALQEKNIFDKPKKQIFTSLHNSNISSKIVVGSDPKQKGGNVFMGERQSEVIQVSPTIDKTKNKLYTQSQVYNIPRGPNEGESPESSFSNCEETIISARSDENRRAKIQKVENILIKRLSENSGMREKFKSVSPVAEKPVARYEQGEFAVKENKLNSCLAYETYEDEKVNSHSKLSFLPPNLDDAAPQITNTINNTTDSNASNAKNYSNLNSIISPFSLNLPLNPPTLEEIDVAASTVNDDLSDQLEHQKKPSGKQQLWIDHSENKDSKTDKPQAPRPRFNAKALAPAQNVLPAWAKKIEVKPITPKVHSISELLPLPLANSACGSGSTTSLDNVGTLSGELTSRDKEIKSWATDYIRDVISLDHRHQRNPLELDSFGNKIASDSDSVNTSFSANSSFYGHLPLHSGHQGDKSFLSEGLSDPLSSRSQKSKEPTLSVAERISKMQEKMEAAKDVVKPIEKQTPTQSQQQFASLLQNRLIDVIAQEAEDDKKERERQRKKKKPKHPPPNSWAAERLRLFGPGKSVIKEESTWSPDQTSTPSTLSRELTKLRINVECVNKETAEGTVEDATNKLEDLSQSFSQNEVVKMNKVRMREGRQFRRVTTGGINIAEMREKFATGTDSSGGSSTESSYGTPKEKTRPNSPWISSSGAFPPSPLVSSVINKLTSAENTDTEGRSPVESREPSLSRSRGRVAERVRHFSSRENSLPNSRSSSRSRRDSEVISGTFDLKTVSELVRRVESSEESGTSLGSSLSFQPGELAPRNSETKLVSEAVRKLHTDHFSSSNSSPSSSLDRHTFINMSTIKSNLSEKQGVKNVNAIAKPFIKPDEDRPGEVTQRLSQAVSSLSNFQPDKSVRSKRMDKERRHTTQINFYELRERYSSMGRAKESKPPQSPAMHAIYASSVRCAESDSDITAGDESSPKELQVARSSTFQKNKVETMKEKLGTLQNTSTVHNAQKKGTEEMSNSNTVPIPAERPQDLGYAFSLNQHVTSTPCSSIVSPGSKPVSARHHDVEDDVFSPLSSARVPESLNLPSDVHPPPAFAFSAKSYEDDMSHGELAESESSDTVEFVTKRYEEKAIERQQQQQQQHYHHKQQQHHQYYLSQQPIISSQQNLQSQNHQQLQHLQIQQIQHVHPLQSHDPSHLSPTPITSSPSSHLLGATAAATVSSSLRHKPTFPETIIDTRTATGHVRCRILSEIPAEPDESGIGASDQSMGSNSTLSVSSLIQDRLPETRPLTPQSSNSTSSLPTTDFKQTSLINIKNHSNIPDIRLSEESSTTQFSDCTHSQIHRKFSLGNESVSSVEGASSLKVDDGLLSPRRASVHAMEHHKIVSATNDHHSSNASLSPDSSKDYAESGNRNNSRHSSNRHDTKRRKSKSKFMQDVMEKRRNMSEPNEAKGSQSRKKHVYSSSDVPEHSDRRGSHDGGRSSNGLFGTTVGGRKKSSGSPNGNDSTNTMKGYSKRFDALWAKFDPELQQKQDSGTSELNGPSTSMLHDEKEAEEKARQEAEERERERMEAEEAARVKAEEEQKKKKKGKRKGLGGLSAEKKKLLKKLIMQRAAEELRNEAKQKAAEKEKYINDRVAPLKTEGLGQSELQALVKDLHARVSTLEEDVYDWEIKIRKQDFEINELTLKVNDTKGKFIKPVLRKVNKTESKLKKIQVLKESTDFRGTLKSTGQNKYALEDDEGDKNNPHWRDELKPKENEEAAAES